MSLSIIFVTLGALGLAGSASFPLLIIGSVGLGLAGFGLIVAGIVCILIKVLLSKIPNEST
ncbi:hypothetical protein O1W69_04985 [Chlamydia sp. 12-01]|uniref:hypothetical protein n=1 Tax=Chlamydia sp. 12-01 TaxID=3002742 RepID=UPI0035D3F0B7